MMRVLLILLATLSCGVLHAAPRTYRIDPEHFSIAFLVGHVGYERLIGQFLEAEGEFVYDEETHTLQSGRVDVHADSVFTNHERRDAHVRSDEFLDAEEHPLVRFVAKSYQANGSSGGTLQGDLTLLGETHPVTVEVRLNKAARYPFGHGKYTLGISARATLRRSAWGMDYGVENGMVGDEVELLFELEAIQQGS